MQAKALWLREYYKKWREIKMKVDALWVVEPYKVEVRPVEVDEPGFGEVQIETKAVGVCAWDSYLYRCMSAPGPAP
jgi:Zn-dependent alcohol dehydrogenase